MLLEYFFWILAILTLYTYFGYSLYLWFTLLFIRRAKEKKTATTFTPEVTIVITAYNEAPLIQTKVQNSREQVYPSDRIKQLWVTDGSNDGSSEILNSLGNVEVLHGELRLGKTAALNRAMERVTTPITILCDANTMLCPTAVATLASKFSDPSVGCVAGEKRIHMSRFENAASSGEGIYWRYESMIKHLESMNGMVLGAAGELYAFRTELFEPLPEDTLLDDLEVSCRIAQKGYRVIYAPDAFALEHGSLSIEDEKKRKVRIAAGAFQFLRRNLKLINMLKHPKFAFQLISHKVLRWVVVPPSIIAAPILNILILIYRPNSLLYQITMGLIVVFLVLAGAGWLLRNRKLRGKQVFVPYYILTMNFSIIKGFFRYIRGNQSAKWEKARRSEGVL